MTDLFITEKNTGIPILLIDASGSVTCNMTNDKLIFDRMCELVNGLNFEEYRVIFWNSNQQGSDNAAAIFKDGIYKLPFVIKKSTLNQTFQYVRGNIKYNCLTFPHLAFECIPADWFGGNITTKIYFITDGKMGYSQISMMEMNNLKYKLGESIKKLSERYNIQLNIITVEPYNREFGEVEALNQAAGCDVYNVIMENKLTKFISKFTSYTLNHPDGFVHINRNTPPAGYVPYCDQYFSELRVDDFIRYLIDVIKKTDDENELLKIVQNLSASLCVLAKDKPKHRVKQMINLFCELFSETKLDQMFVKFILADAIEKENAGMANIFAYYRAQLKDLYKRANELLNKDVRDAIGIGDSFLTLPVENKIIRGYSKLIDQNMMIDGKLYPESAIKINHLTIPVIPFKYSNSFMNEQCLRQWVRQLISKMYGVNALEDIVIYLILGIVLRIVKSDIEEEVKESYRRLATIMLKKKRMNTDQTELERLENGELPVPNSGKIENFYGFMGRVGEILGLKLEPFTIWYLLCLALNNEKIVNKQLIHCRDSIEQDFPGCEYKKLLEKINVNKIELYKIPLESMLDYRCLITLDDVSEIGGYRFLPHQNLSGNVCSPIYVLSNEGYETLISDISQCPLCYTRLNENSFEKVGAKPADLGEIIFDENVIDPFKNKVNISSMNSEIAKVTKVEKKNGKCILITCKGVVGSGKSTYSRKIKKKIEEIGGYCIVEGTDKYCKDGMSIPDAIKKVNEELLKATKMDNELIVIIIDTCGERTDGNNIFGVDFSNWRRVNLWPNLDRNNMKGYLSWSMRNVLRRKKRTGFDDYYLNPEDAGVSTCISVHKKKTTALFGKKVPAIFSKTHNNIDEAIRDLDESANEYEGKLKMVDEDIGEFIEKKIKV